MKALIICIASLVAGSAAQAQDTWTGPDKKLHVAGSFAVGVVAGIYVQDNKPLAFGLAMVPGTVKELLDARQGGTGFSGKDMVANALGAALGVYASSWLVTYAKGTTRVSYATTF